MVEDPAAVGQRAIARLLEAGSARFASWVSIGEIAPRAEDLSATGTTDFRALETRTTRQALASAILRDGTNTAARSRRPLDKLLLGGSVWVMKRVGMQETRERFYTQSQRWEQTAPGGWIQREDSPARPGYRDGADPALVLESLSAITDIVVSTSGPVIRGTPTVKLQARADLDRVRDRFESFLSIGDSHRRTAGWFDRAPVNLWIDGSGLPRRVSYAPLRAISTEPLWRTLELFDFGTGLERPRLSETDPDGS